MPANRFRSRSYKRMRKNTPGGENVLSRIDEPIQGKLFSFSEKYLHVRAKGVAKNKGEIKTPDIGEKLEKQIKDLSSKEY